MCCIYIKFYKKGGCHGRLVNTFKVFFRACRKGPRSCDCQNFKSSELLYDNETQGSGMSLPELPHPKHSNAHNTMLWEITLLKNHYQPWVRQFAAHLGKMAPTSGEGQLPVDLLRRDPKQFLQDFKPTEIFFGIEFPKKCSTKKRYFKSGTEFTQPEFSQIVADTCRMMDGGKGSTEEPRKDSVT